jgi:hypothetical protein
MKSQTFMKIQMNVKILIFEKTINKIWLNYYFEMNQKKKKII